MDGTGGKVGINKKSIMEMANGGFLEQVDYEMDKVIKNILDPNTRATGKRRITVTMELIPDDLRKNIAVRFFTKLNLVPINPLTTSLYIAGETLTGEMQVVENAPQIPGQISMNGEEQSAPPLLKIFKTS